MSNKLTREEEQRTVIQDSASIRKRLTPRQAIREHCIDCVGTASAIRDCQGNDCMIVHASSSPTVWARAGFRSSSSGNSAYIAWAEIGNW